ncbi:ceramide synthase 1 [Denticeps clupeoides]|uniref:TLC domain-containing protein n=1 Tax=Denticeps clupeoides TaxID=299321 RepID=A0AAY4DDL8_9TELE|nr:ceramide synthase 1 [Denticeps clupeoides]
MNKPNGADAGPAKPMPGYGDLVAGAYATMLGAFRDCEACGVELSRRTLLENARVSPTEIGLFFACVVLWTQVRRGLTTCLFQPFAQWCCLRPKDTAKMPESAWKMFFYTMSWSYSTYLIFFTQYTFFQDPPSVFSGWKRGMSVPTDIAFAYLIQGSFYGHSIYAAVYMDAWRKDSPVMLVHHVITLALITFSYAFRYHNIGILVLFLHDINDIQLEFTKLNIYFKTRGGRDHMINEILSHVGTVCFAATWFLFRLYWFPLKVLYASCITSLQYVPNIPFYFFFNFLLFALLLMNVYWFLYIIFFVMKVVSGQMKEVSDVREYEDEIDVTETKKQNTGAGHQNSAEGKHIQNGITKDKHL